MGPTCCLFLSTGRFGRFCQQTLLLEFFTLSLRRRGYVSGYAFAQSNTTVDVSRRCVKPLRWTARAPQTLSRTVAGTSKPPLPRAVARAGSERRQRAALGSPFRSCSGTPGTTCHPLRRRRGRDEAFGILGGPSAHDLVQPIRPEDPGGRSPKIRRGRRPQPGRQRRSVGKARSGAVRGLHGGPLAAERPLCGAGTRAPVEGTTACPGRGRAARLGGCSGSTGVPLERPLRTPIES